MFRPLALLALCKNTQHLTNVRIKNYFPIMNEPRNKQQDIAGLSLSRRQKHSLFSSERQFTKAVSMVSNLLVSLSPYPSPFFRFESPIVCDCLSLNTFHFACDNTRNNDVKNKYLLVRKKGRECKIECIFVGFISCLCVLKFHVAKTPKCKCIFY